MKLEQIFCSMDKGWDDQDNTFVGDDLELKRDASFTRGKQTRRGDTLAAFQAVVLRSHPSWGSNLFCMSGQPESTDEDDKSHGENDVFDEDSLISHFEGGKVPFQRPGTPRFMSPRIALGSYEVDPTRRLVIEQEQFQRSETPKIKNYGRNMDACNLYFPEPQSSASWIGNSTSHESQMASIPSSASPYYDEAPSQSQFEYEKTEVTRYGTQLTINGRDHVYTAISGLKVDQATSEPQRRRNRLLCRCLKQGYVGN